MWQKDFLKLNAATGPLKLQMKAESMNMHTALAFVHTQEFEAEAHGVRIIKFRTPDSCSFVPLTREQILGQSWLITQVLVESGVSQQNAESTSTSKSVCDFEVAD